MRWLWLLAGVAFMANNFVPIKDGDWQALNITLEDIFYAKSVEAKAKVVKQPVVDTTQERTIDGSDGQPADPESQSEVIATIDDTAHLRLYAKRIQSNPDVGLPTTGAVHGTLAGQTIPSSFYLDLRLHNNSSTVRHITADWLVLHDNSTPWKTIGLTNVDEINTVSVAGPIAGGRDQSAAYSYSWVHFFIIYNSSTEEVSSLSSLSPTAPTLPTGYDYYVRVGVSYFIAGLGAGQQINNRVWSHSYALNEAEPGTAEVAESVDLSDDIPPTAISMFGYFGLTSDVGSETYMRVSSTASAGDTFVDKDFLTGAFHGLMGGSTYFHLPVLEVQTIYWLAHVKHPHYGIHIKGWIDDL